MKGGRTIERTGTDHVTSGPMGGLKKIAPDGADRQSDEQTDTRTWQLYSVKNGIQ